jgi:hypothetical protein
MGPKATARAARWADGVDGAWTVDGDLDHMTSSFAMVRDAWGAAGRSEAPHLSSSIWYALGPNAEDRLRTYARGYMRIFGEGVGDWAASQVNCFTPDSLRRAVEHAAEAGADEFFLVPTSADPDELARAVDVLGDLMEREEP